MRARGKLVAALIVAAGGSGCDWRDFDSLQQATPVLAVEAPSGYPSGNDFAQLLIATRPPGDGSAAARFVTSGLLQTALAYVTISPGGSASGHVVTSPTLDNLAGQPITSLAAVPGTDRALLGGGGTVLTLDLSVSPPAVGTLDGITPAIAAEPYLGAGVAAGAVTGSATPDLVVASATGLHVFVGGGSTELAATASAACPIALGASVVARDRIQRAVLIAPLVGAGPVIAIGTPGVGGPGNVSFFAADTTAGTLSCLFSLSAPGAEPEFGRSLAVGRFQETGFDLLVGAPPQHAYIYQAPLAAGAAPKTTLTGHAAAGYFGAAVASLAEVGQPLDTVFVGDPAATTQGQEGAGEVIEFGGVEVGPTPGATLADRSAGTNDAYGSSVAALPFCASPPCATPTLLPLVGAANKAFVYFALFSGDDPRAK
ncbi:MAG TPA: hypothetical protein VHH90_05090 [Polyangia bacterium]|nr:hypothetical protein [Polyangia bacterium]